MRKLRIFIAGCGRSGTSLTRDLMNCFQDMYILNEGPYGESPFSRFRDFTNMERNVVIKRTGDCWRTLPSLPDDIDLIYCVRHPFDVMTSTHPLTKHLRKYHITPERWSSEYHALRELKLTQPDRRIFFLRYEDLTHTPNIVQKKISDHFGIRATYPFDTNSLGIDIFTNSNGKWQRQSELYNHLQTIPHRFRSLLNDFCTEFEYALPEGYVVGSAITKEYLSLLFINNPNGLEDLKGQPFFWMGGQPTVLDIYSVSPGRVFIYFEAKAGPSNRLTTIRTIRITSESWNKLVRIRPGKVKLEIMVQAGENQVAFEVIEQPIVPILPKSDMRPLMLGVLNLQIMH